MSSNENNFSRDVYSISRLNREVRTVIETGFPLLWIEGEISNFARPASGHWYFSLKDEAAQVRCAMFRNKNQLVKVLPENGKQVLVRARISLYEPRGDFQVIVEHMEEAGDGALRRKFDLLKKKLADEGLFDSSHKKPLPEIIRKVGIITSSTGAAIHDILSTLKRRFPMQAIIVYPVPVQGKGAADKIAAMINRANQRKETDVLILARGGGSLEDLWEFNEESVARMIFNSAIPVVSGVGHEVDFTIADFVADHRAATPTAAAEMISPDKYQFLQNIELYRNRLERIALQRLQHQQQKLDWLGRRIRHPRDRITALSEKFNDLYYRQVNAIRQQLKSSQSEIRFIREKLNRHNPVYKYQQLEQQFDSLKRRFDLSSTRTLTNKQKQLQHLVHTLDTLSPLQTVKRGFAIVRDADNHIISNVKKIKHGTQLKTELTNGYIISTVDKKHETT